MTRPPSITAFDRLYLASIGVYLINGLLYWSATRELMVRMPQMRSAPGLEALVTPIMIATLVITVGVSLLFWHLVVRQRSVAGKWLVGVTEAIGAAVALLALLRLVRGTAPNAPSAALSVLAAALAIAAALMLFRPDARAWFGEASPRV